MMPRWPLFFLIIGSALISGTADSVLPAGFAGGLGWAATFIAGWCCGERMEIERRRP